MSSKRKPLDIAAIASSAVAQPDPVRVAVARPAPVPAAARLQSGAGKGGRFASKPSRAGRVAIQGWYPEATRRSLKALAAKEGRTTEELLGEAIADLFAKYKVT